ARASAIRERVDAAPDVVAVTIAAEHHACDQRHPEEPAERPRARRLLGEADRRALLRAIGLARAERGQRHQALALHSAERLHAQGGRILSRLLDLVLAARQ